MKIPHKTSFDDLLFLTNHYYALQATQISFIQLGDKSYSYKVSCLDGGNYYLKLLDKHHQQNEVLHTDCYLPLLSELNHKNLFPPSIHPIMTNQNRYKTEMKTFILILFPWIEGHTLADAYPLSEKHVRSIAKLAAKLHLTTPNISNTIKLPVEKFDISFLNQLLSYLKILNGSMDDHHLALAKLVLPKEKDIILLIEHLKKLAYSINRNKAEFVLCHGDLWGGNLIQSNTGIRIIDWESVIFAPMEREMAGYVTQRPVDFIDAYSEELGRKIKPNTDLLRFYSFQAQLHNLTYWMRNILFHKLDETQQENDLDMIENHCLNKWESIEESLQELESVILKMEKY